ncbi:MAG: hypothetical protein ACRYF9_08630 [Janthinobacterium lividum]|uniref:hypothetical protein n=1 Tax=Pseudomonas TaxID=286 RepID=UPI001CFAAB3A|nr:MULTISPECIES: hypothetical protein [Pseudomonas]
MIDYKTENRCLLSTIASGEMQITGRTSQTVTALILAGFLADQKTCEPDGMMMHRVSLTPAGHRLLEGLWY